MVRSGDLVLDIGCGDGGYTSRFLAPRASHVDAVDVEGSAIKRARRDNSRSNVAFMRLDAITENFPRASYHLIVMDGVIGHLQAEDSRYLLLKIASCLSGDGVFFGSESLGRIEGHDHLQFFDGKEDVRSILKDHFRRVLINEFYYDIGRGFVRREAIGRCSNSERDLTLLN